MSVSVSEVAQSARTSPAPKLNRRAESKAKTRRKVLQSARTLFMERGYEGATMRDIASEAGLSTGALFANFQDKADLFNEVLAEDLRAQAERMESLELDGKPIRQSLLAMMRAGYELHLSQLPLLQAALSVSWTQGLKGELGERPVRAEVVTHFLRLLDEAAAGGDIDAKADRQLIAETLWDCYLANYRRAIFAGWGLDQLTDYAGRQIDMLLAGARKR